MPLSQNWRSEISWLFKKMKTAYQTYMKTKKSLVKLVQKWFENNQKCKFKMSVKLCDKLTWCSKIVIFSTKLNQFVPNFYRV